MTDQQGVSATPVERRHVPEASAHALANSVPDDNHMLMRMLKFLLRPPQSIQWMLPLTSLGGVLIILVYVVAKWGVPAILAMQTLILQLHEDQTSLATADKQIQREQVTATKEVLSALHGIGSKLDNQGHKLDEQGNQIEQLAIDVGTLKREQAEGSRRISAIAAEQKRLRADRTVGVRPE